MRSASKHHLPDPGRPYLILRLSISDTCEENWRQLYPQLKKYRKGFDEVWFSTGGVFPKLELHRENALRMARCADDVRKLGWLPSLQVQATIGHSDGQPAEGKTWGGYVGRNGEVCRSLNCPRQPGFLNYLREMSRMYAQWHPASVWIDDDLRLRGHFPAVEPYGCYCPDCLAAFSREQHHVFSRQELVELCEKDAGLLKKWIDFGTRSLCGAAEAVVQGFKEISPETKFGLQHNNDLSRLPVFETLKKASGKRSGSRPACGAYCDHEPYVLIDAATLMSRQIFEQQGYDTLGQICAEIESCPRGMCCKTPQGYRIESLLYLSLGADSLSLYMLGTLESARWYGENLLPPYAREAESYREFIRHTSDTVLSGLGLPAGNAPHQTVRSLGLPLIGIPFASFSPDALCRMVTAAAAEALSDDDLRRVLRGNVWLDGAAVKVIQERGMSGVIGGITVSLPDREVSDLRTDDPMNDGLFARTVLPYTRCRFILNVPEKLPVRVLSRYRGRADQKDSGISALIFERPDGTRAAVCGNDGFNTYFATSSQVTLCVRIADWLTGNRMAVLPLDPVQSVIVPRVTRQGVPRAAVILNTTISTQKKFRLEVRNVSAGKYTFHWCVPSKKPLPLSGEQQGRSVLVTVPAIAPWGIGWLKIARIG
ncbi:MAG: hypothetical protein IJU70_06025 [Lentisphaeria bacterium]|nr:hypothetical protein [Lentisphaeria bacterium]